MYDPAKAKALLAEAGFPNGEGLPEITLMHNTSEGHAKIAAFAQQSFKDALGVEIKLANQEWGVYINTVNEDAPQIYRMGWGADYPDENNWVLEVFHPTKSINSPKWDPESPSAKEFMRLTEEAASEPDPAKRKQLYFEAEKILTVDQAIIITLLGLKIDTAHILPVPEHHDRITDLLHLLESVRYEDHGEALVLQLPHERKQDVNVGAFECSGWFIQDEERRLSHESLHDLNELEFCREKVSNAPVQVNPRTQFVREPPDRLPGFRVFQEPCSAGGFTAQDDVLPDGQVGNQAQVLVDHADSGIRGIHRRSKTNVLSPVGDCAVIGAVSTVDDPRHR